MLILIQNISLLPLGVGWVHYCIRHDCGASVGEVSLHLFLVLNMCQQLLQSYDYVQLPRRDLAVLVSDHRSGF